MILVHHQIALRALRKRQRRVMLGVEGSRVGEIRHIQSDVVARIHAPGVLQLGAVDDMDVVPGYDLARIAQVRRLQRGVVAGGHGSAIVDTLGLHREIVACLQAAPVVRLPARRDRQIMLGVENPAIAELFRLDDDVLVGLHLASLSNPPREVTVISLPAVNVPGLETLAATIVAASLTCILPALRAAPEVVSVALLAMTSAPVSLSNDAAVTVTPSRTFRLPVLDTAPPALTCNGPIRRILLEKRVSCREVRFAAPPRWVTCAASAMASAETV